MIKFYSIALYYILFSGVIFSSNKPNIIFFIVDDYDKSETSVYGGNVLTPHLDELSKAGITFNNAHMTSTVCTPSRYTCMTGRYASSSYHAELLEACPIGTQSLPAFNVGLEDDHMNVAKVLSDHGYATGMVGKFHVGGHALEEGPPKGIPYSEKVNQQQFDFEKNCRDVINNFGYSWAKNIYMGNMKAPFKGHNPDWTISAALEFVEEHQKDPFFLYYGTTLLHGPNKEWFNSLDKPLVSGAGMLETPISLTDRKSIIERLKKAGMDSVEKAGFLWMDDTLGLLIDKLKSCGIYDNTLICFVADHGSTRKGSLYTINGTEVPCIMSWPNGMKAGIRSDSLIQNTDFVPTWFDLANVTLPKNYKIDGVSLKPIFKAPETSVRNYTYHEMGASRAIKTKEWSYMTLRFTKSQVDEMRSNDRIALKTLSSLSGGISRGRENPNSINYD